MICIHYFLFGQWACCAVSPVLKNPELDIAIQRCCASSECCAEQTERITSLSCCQCSSKCSPACCWPLWTWTHIAGSSCSTCSPLALLGLSLQPTYQWFGPQDVQVHYVYFPLVQTFRFSFHYMSVQAFYLTVTLPNSVSFVNFLTIQVIN